MPPAAATRRTTPRATKPADNDFDARRKALKKGKKKVTGTLTAFGQEWSLRPPNQALIARLFDSDDASSMLDYVLAHVIKEQRDDFAAKLVDPDEDLDTDDIELMCEQVTAEVYADLPTPPS